MKRKQEDPSVIGLLLLVTGMLLISVALLGLLKSGEVSTGTTKVMFGVAAGGIAALAAGAVLNRRKVKR